MTAAASVMNAFLRGNVITAVYMTHTIARDNHLSGINF
jgi:hypothetical protein